MANFKSVVLFLKIISLLYKETPVITKLTLPFVNAYQHAKKSAHFINSLSLDTADFRVP